MAELTRQRLLGEVTQMDPLDQAEHVRDGFLLDYTGNTAAAYSRDLAHYFAWCHMIGVDVMAANRVVVSMYARDLGERQQRPMSKASVARHLATLSGFYMWAEREDVIVRNPVAHVRRPKVAKNSQQLGLDAREALRLVTAAEEKSRLANALVSLLLYDGLRISEALGAQVADIYEDHGHRALTITSKGDVKRPVKLNALTVHALNTYLAGRGSGPLFTKGDTEMVLDHGTAFRLVRRVAKEAGIEHWARIGPHSLRHTFVTLSRQAGISLEDVQDAAGHADPRTTRRYDRARFSLANHPADRLADWLATQAPPEGDDG
jgi:site-specific recombinase XerD